MAQAIDADLYVVYIDMGQDATPGHQKSLKANIAFAENMGATVAHLKGKTVAAAVAEFVNEKHITQVVFGRSATQWVEAVFLSFGHPSVFARCAGSGCAYCDSGTGVNLKTWLNTNEFS